MNRQIERLYHISAKQSRIILGLMSGTSLDGLDMALCKIEGSGPATVLQVLQYATCPYANETKEQILQVFSRKDVNLPLVTKLNASIGLLHAGLINNQLAKWGVARESVDLIASHGQTIYHYPGSDINATLQIGDGDRIAVETGIITISDFRQKNIAGGGEGAPLAGYGDVLLFSDKERDVLLLNIGGISNFTLLKKNGEVMCTDVGPGNTMMDAFVRKNFSGLSYDTDGEIAATGVVNKLLLEGLSNLDWFGLPFPKSTGPEIFNLQLLNEQIAANKLHLSDADILATLNAFTADTIIYSIRNLASFENLVIYPSGGGVHNKQLMNRLKQGLAGVEFGEPASKGILPDAKEAVLFAILANETVAGDPAFFKKTANLVPITMGKISLPG